MVSHQRLSQFGNVGFMTYNSRQDKIPGNRLNVTLLSNMYIANLQTLNHSVPKC